MKHLRCKIFFWDAPAQGTMFGLTLFICLFIVGLLSGCVSQAEAAKNSSNTKAVLSETLLNADLSNASSCRQAGKQRQRLAVASHQSGGNCQAKAFLLEAVSLQEKAVGLRSQLDKMDTQLLFVELASSCEAAREIFADEPETFQSFCRRAIQHINLCLTEAPLKILSLAMLEYKLAVLYLLLGDEKEAFQAADCAWRDGYRNWDGNVREQLRNYMLDNGIVASHLPPPRPRSTLQGKLLFPINVLPDILVDVVCCTGYGFYAAGDWFASGKPGAGIVSMVMTPIMMPFAGCIKGVDDAWRGLSFWQLTPMWKEKEEF